LTESLSEASLTVTHVSGFGDDSILAGVPCIGLRFSFTDRLGIGETGLGSGGIIAKSTNELRQIIERYRSSEEFRNYCADLTIKAADEIFESFGTEAVLRTVDEIVAMID
jgi:hypothetical protein